MDILDIFGHFYLNHLSPLWGYFWNIRNNPFKWLATRVQSMMLRLNEVEKCTMCTISVISDSTDKVDLLVDQFRLELAFVVCQNNGIGFH